MTESKKCKKIREVLRQGSEPGDAEFAHLGECASCAKFLDGERRLSNLIRTIPKVIAPEDLAARVRSEIEARRSGSRQSGSFRLLGYAVPAAAVVLIAILLYASFLSGPGGGAQVAEKGDRDISDQQQEPDTEAAKEPGADDDPGSTSTPQRAEASPPAAGEPVPLPSKGSAGQSTPVRKRSREPKKDDSRSIDFAAKAPRTINPPGLDPTRPVDQDRRDEPDRSFTGKEILSEFGITADFENGDWAVKAVRAGSIAERAGVLAGDRVKALDGSPISEEPVYGRTVSGKELQIVRGGVVRTVRITPN